MRLATLDHLQAQKKTVARAYNKRVKIKNFRKSDLVWKAILPIRLKDSRFEQCSPNWECPFLISKCWERGHISFKTLTTKDIQTLLTMIFENQLRESS